MKSYNEMHGDLLRLFDMGLFDAIGHGANCFCRMKSGIAGEISRKFPGAVEADNKTIVGDKSKLGTFTYWDHQNGGRLYNLYSQYNYGRIQGNLYLDYDALTLSLFRMRNDLISKINKKIEVGLPQIGCGLAQGDWSRVKSIIEEVFKDHYVTVVIYKDPESYSEKLL